MSPDVSRHVSTRSTTGDAMVELDVKQDAGARQATGVFRFRDSRKNATIEATELGVIQVAERWATFSGRARVSASGPALPFRVIVDQADPFQSGAATVWVDAEGFPGGAVPLAPGAVRIMP